MFSVGVPHSRVTQLPQWLGNPFITNAATKTNTQKNSDLKWLYFPSIKSKENCFADWSLRTTFI